VVESPSLFLFPSPLFVVPLKYDFVGVSPTKLKGVLETVERRTRIEREGASGANFSIELLAVARTSSLKSGEFFIVCIFSSSQEKKT
jgi:hypothetical protein